MRPDVVGLVSPAFDQHLGFQDRLEDLSVEQLVTEFPIERFNVPVLPRGPWLDVESSHVELLEPCSDGNRGELRAVVRANEFGRTSESEELREPIKDMITGEPSLDIDREALPGVFVDQREHRNGSSIVGAIEDEIIAPNVTPSLGATPNAGSRV